MENENKKNGKAFGIASMVCGIISLIWGIIPCVGLVALPVAVISIIFGCISYKQSRDNSQPSGMAIAGLVTSIFALIFVIAWIVAIFRSSPDDILNGFRTKFDWKYEETSDIFNKPDTTMTRLGTLLDSMNKTENVNMIMTSSDSSFNMSVNDENGKKVMEIVGSDSSFSMSVTDENGKKVNLKFGTKK